MVVYSGYSCERKACGGEKMNLTKKELVELIYAYSDKYTKTYLNTTPKDGLEWLREEEILPNIQGEFNGCIEH